MGKENFSKKPGGWLTPEDMCKKTGKKRQKIEETGKAE